MLILTRRPGQIIKITPHETLNPATPIGELFESGDIEIKIVKTDGYQVRLGINAHPDLLVLRKELELKTKKIRV